MRESLAISCNKMQLPSNRLAHAGQKAASSDRTCGMRWWSDFWNNSAHFNDTRHKQPGKYDFGSYSLFTGTPSAALTLYSVVWQASLRGELYDSVHTSTLHTSRQTSLPTDPAHTNIKWCQYTNRLYSHFPRSCLIVQLEYVAARVILCISLVAWTPTPNSRIHIQVSQ